MAVAAFTLLMSAIMCFAVTQQEFSWGVFPFVTLFGTLFGSVLVFCFAVYRQDKFRDLAKHDYPDQPWMWDPCWRSEVIPSRNKSDFRGTLALFIILSMFALVSVAQIIDKRFDNDLWARLGALLSVIPIIAAAYFGRNLYRAWKSLSYDKRISLVLETCPAWIGSAFTARMIISQELQPDHVKVQLEHFKVIRQEESDGTTFSKVIDRKIAGRVETSLEETGERTAKICIDIPPGSPETGWDDEADGAWWEAVITLCFNRADVTLRYQVPVAEPTRYRIAC